MERSHGGEIVGFKCFYVCYEISSYKALGGAWKMKITDREYAKKLLFGALL